MAVNMEKFKSWFSEKVLGLHPAPYSLPGFDDWDAYKLNIKKEKPLAYFIVYQVPDAYDWVKYKLKPIDRAVEYCANRFISKDHILVTSYPLGLERNNPDFMLYANFSILVRMVEYHSAVRFMSLFKNMRSYYRYPFLRNHFSWARYKPWHNREAGLHFLQEQMMWDDPDGEEIHPNQALEYRETYELYLWWTITRPARPTSWVGSGYEQFHRDMHNKYGEDKGSSVYTADELARRNACSQLMNDLDDNYREEDDAMLLRLIKHRMFLDP